MLWSVWVTKVLIPWLGYQYVVAMSTKQFYHSYVRSYTYVLSRLSWCGTVHVQLLTSPTVLMPTQHTLSVPIYLFPLYVPLLKVMTTSQLPLITAIALPIVQLVAMSTLFQLMHVYVVLCTHEHLAIYLPLPPRCWSAGSTDLGCSTPAVTSAVFFAGLLAGVVLAGPAGTLSVACYNWKKKKAKTRGK